MDAYEIGEKVEDLVREIKDELKIQIKNPDKKWVSWGIRNNCKNGTDNGNYNPYVKEAQIYLRGNCREYRLSIGIGKKDKGWFLSLKRYEAENEACSLSFLTDKTDNTSSCDIEEKLTIFLTNYIIQTWKIKENKCFWSAWNLKKS